MAFLVPCGDAKCCNFLFLVIKLCFLIMCFLGPAIGARNSNESINIGAIIDVDSRVGKEQKAAMIIAAESYNNISTNHKLNIHFRNTTNNPIQAVFAAEELIKEKQVQVIVGMQTWEQAVLVADVGRKAQVPVLSLASASNRHQFMQHRWPFLVPIVPNSLEQINCIASIIRSYYWRKVIAIYEDNTYGGDSEMIAVLSEALQGVDAEIEAHLVLPPISSVSDPEGIVRDEVVKLLTQTQSRVFVVLRSSLPLATHLFREAKKIGLMSRDSVWIVADSLSNLLDSVDTNFISSAQGALGTKMYYSEETHFLDFKHQFQRVLRKEFADEQNLEPGIHALQAYDGITAISKAVMELGSRSNTTSISMSLLRKIRSNNFTGLTGDIHFHDEALSSPSIFRIVNIVGKSYKELGFWSSKFGFAESHNFENKETNLSAVDGARTMQNLTGLVNWPGELNRIPKGWAMPTDARPMKIGIPGRTVFEKFVKVDWVANDNSKKKYDGFCIDLFEEILKLLEQNYSLPYTFFPYNGSYDDLVDHVSNQTYDAVVGDITILADRSKHVDFTHPYAESGLSMLVPVKHEAQRAWMFMKPFSVNMWIATFSIIFYTMFVVWCMEHQDNRAFKGPWKDQLGTALWFTFSSLFFAHKESIKSNYSKAVVIVWLFLVYIVTSSYQASLTSMLTIPRIEPNVTDIQFVRRTNAPVGCDGDSFVKDYLQNVLEIRSIKNISSQDAYPGEFESRNITAAFLELPYQKVFLREYCNQYTAVGPTYRFGGLGFVFQKGSPIARDFSQAILTLLENGKLNRLEDEWFGSSMNCSSSDDSDKTESLRFESFWGIYLISCSTSTICLLIFVARLIKRSWKRQEAYQNGAAEGSRGIKGILDMVVELAPHGSGSSRSMSKARTFAQRWTSTRWDLVSPSDPSERFEASPEDESKLV